MSNPTVFPSKYVAETVTVRWNFVDELQFGETIVSANIQASVFQGVDVAPSDIITGSVAISGTVVSQHLIRGLPGVIYTLSCTAVGSSGTTYVKVSRQAVISNLGGYNESQDLALIGDLPNGSLGAAYFEHLDIVGGVPPYNNLRLIAGAMPAWMSHNIVGAQVIYTGVPNALGISTFTPEITDFVGQRANDPQIVAVNDVVDITGDIVNGITGDALSYQYTIVGGTAPYVVTITSGTLPTGDNSDIDNTGLVTGTYSTKGIYVWTVHVVDINGLMADVDDTCEVGAVLWLLTSTDTLGQGGYILSDGVTWNGPIEITNIPRWIPSVGAATGTNFSLHTTNESKINTNKGNPLNWQNANAGQNGSSTNNADYRFGVLMLVKNGDYVSRSTDGLNFTNAYTGFVFNAAAIAIGANITMVTGYYSSISTDLGISFTVNPTIILDAGNSFKGLATDDEIFIAVGTNNNIRYTTDGIGPSPWIAITSPFVGTLEILYITWTDGVWVMANIAGEVAYSFIGTDDWIITDSLGDVPSDIYGIAGRVAICGEGGKLMVCKVSDMIWSHPTTVFGIRNLYTIDAIINPV